MIQQHLLLARHATYLQPYVNVVIACCGIKLCLNWDIGAFYLDVSMLHSKKILKAALLMIEEFGLELMDDWECPSEVFDDGTTRTWLALRDERQAEIAAVYP